MLIKLVIIVILLITLVPIITYSDDYFIAKKECDFTPYVNNAKQKSSIDYVYKVSKTRNNLVDVYSNSQIFSIDANCGIITSFVPFFSGTNMLFDLPPEPILDDFDKNILQVCGKLGSVVNIDDVLKAFEQNGFLHTLYEGLDNTIEDGSSQTFSAFKKKVIDVWVKNDGFRRIFCGLISDGELQGLNYIGRYVDAYHNGWLGYDSSCSKNENKHSIYAFGVLYVIEGGKIGRQCALNSFYTLSAKELIIEATRAYKQFSKSTGTCIHYITYNDDDVYAAILTKKDDSILSFEANIKNSCHSGDCECK